MREELKHFIGIQLLAFVLALTTFSKVATASGFRTVACDESKMIDIFVKPNMGTIINFPIKPENIVLGGKKMFSVEYIKNDVVITALSSGATTNLFVYLLGRRCGFQLVVSNVKQDSLIRVSDTDDSKMKVQFK